MHTPEFDLSNDMARGVVFGVLAGMMIPMIILTRKRFLIDSYNSWDISAYEMAFVAFILVPVMLFSEHLFEVPTQQDFMLLLLLGLVSTGLARILLVRSQRFLRGKTVGLTITLEVILRDRVCHGDSFRDSDSERNRRWSDHHLGRHL